MPCLARVSMVWVFTVEDKEGAVGAAGTLGGELGVDACESSMGDTSGKWAFGLDALVPAFIWAGTKGPATSPQKTKPPGRLWSRPVTTL
jgi:hypothetical protein